MSLYTPQHHSFTEECKHFWCSHRIIWITHRINIMVQNTKISLIVSKVSVYFLVSNFVQSELVNIFNFAGQAALAAAMTWLLVSHPTQYRGAGCLSSNNTLFLQALRTSCGLQTGRQTLTLKCWNRHRDNFLCESGILHRGSFLLASFVEGGTLPLADKCPVIELLPQPLSSHVSSDGAWMTAHYHMWGTSVLHVNSQLLSVNSLSKFMASCNYFIRNCIKVIFYYSAYFH